MVICLAKSRAIGGESDVTAHHYIGPNAKGSDIPHTGL